MALPIRRRGDETNNGASTRHDDNRPVRWLPTDPFADLHDIYRRMDQMMRSFGTRLEPSGWSSFPVDIEETDDAYVVEIDLPGVTRDDVTLEWNDRELTIRGEFKQRERKGFFRQQTRRIGQFHHTVTLPGEIDGEQISASLDDGVLLIRAPKTRSARSRRIQISTGQRAD
ncbi:Hsp20/alpha crystallin family protein [Kribbella sp. NPDC006257]|uniref:Hsp20/alpha crystallin family protein n=1 Tax=Kribbella sp. NPDC006257 TaxID=3156738 RepID=UPI0033B69E1B